MRLVALLFVIFLSLAVGLPAIAADQKTGPDATEENTDVIFSDATNSLSRLSIYQEAGANERFKLPMHEGAAPVYFGRNRETNKSEPKDIRNIGEQQ